MGTTGGNGGNFVISLDYELMWGVKDHATRDSYGRNVLGGREAIPAMLDLFDRRGVRATWATVGALLCESKDELIARARAAGTNDAETAGFADVGPDERHDPYHFGASLARQIASCDGQEIGTHTFSHTCALEDGQRPERFAADVSAALQQLGEWGIRCRSIVFPRNQYAGAHLEACSRLGLTHFRGNEKAWFYAPAPGSEQTALRRGCRLADSYIGLSGANVSRPEAAQGPLVNVSSSRFLRPFSRRLAPLDGLRLRRIEKAMEEAARAGATYHLWWHPENFGTNLAENMRMLTKVLDSFKRLHETRGMRSRAMHEIGGRPTAERTSYAA